MHAHSPPTHPCAVTGMRGDERVQDGMFSYVSLEQRVA
jgi:hypothetical protein